MKIIVPIIAVIIVVPIIAMLSLYYAWSASYLWAWFVAPAFNLPLLTIHQFWEINLLISVMWPRTQFVKEEYLEKKVERAVSTLLVPLIALGIGYIIKFWWTA